MGRSDGHDLMGAGPGSHRPEEQALTPATLHAARQALPLWVICAPLVAPLLAVPITAGMAALAAAIAGRGLRGLDPAAHWTERARHVFVTRRALALGAVLAVAAAIPLTVGGPLSVGTGADMALTNLLAATTALAMAFRFEDRHVQRVGAAARLRSFVSVSLALFPGYVALVFVAPMVWTRGGPAVLLPYAALVVLLTLGGGVLLLRLVGWVRPAPERLRTALARLSAPDPPPRLWTVRVLHANAFALHGLRAVVFTEGALACLDDEQLTAVLAHELEHLREPLGVRVGALLAAVLLPIGIPALSELVRGRSPLAALLLLDAALLLLVLVLRLHRRLRRAMEQRSDRAASAASPAYASALEVISRENLTPAVLRGRRVHPDLVDRLAAAGVTPSWPRPAPPPPLRLAVLATILAAVSTFSAALELRERLGAPGGDEGAALRAVAVSGQADALASLGFARWRQGRLAEGIPLLHAARELEPWRPVWGAWEAMALASDGRCDEARAAIAVAQASTGGPELDEVLATAGEALATCAPR